MSQTAHDFDFRSAIEAAISEFEKAANAKDAETIANMYAEDATLLPPGSPLIKGRANIRAFWQSFFDAGASDASLRVVEVGSAGDLAYEIGTFQAKLPSPQGGTAPASGKYVVAWKRQADGIKLVADIFNLDA
jgi:uncharacterized protein (TIGR02246 family)